MAESSTLIALVKPPPRAPPHPAADDSVNVGQIVGFSVLGLAVLSVVIFAMWPRRASRLARLQAAAGNASGTGGGSSWAGVGSGAVWGRALVLSSTQAASGVTVRGQRYQRRTMTLEVELPGSAPYQVSGSFLVPRGATDAIPGSSLDVTVNPGNAQDVTVLGPGGFTGPWLRQGPPQAF